jgi:hypothetical protein
VTGRIRRFGRGVLNDVGERMVGQLAEGLGGERVPVPAAIVEGVAEDDTPPVSVIPPPPGAPGCLPLEPVEVVAVVEVEMLETELADPFDAVKPDDDELAPSPDVAAPDPGPVPEPQPEPDLSKVGASAGTGSAARSVAPATAASTTTSSTARRVGPVLIGIAVLWLLKKLLSRSKR